MGKPNELSKSQTESALFRNRVYTKTALSAELIRRVIAILKKLYHI